MVRTPLRPRSSPHPTDRVMPRLGSKCFDRGPESVREHPQLFGTEVCAELVGQEQLWQRQAGAKTLQLDCLELLAGEPESCSGCQTFRFSGARWIGVCRLGRSHRICEEVSEHRVARVHDDRRECDADEVLKR